MAYSLFRDHTQEYWESWRLGEPNYSEVLESHEPLSLVGAACLRVTSNLNLTLEAVQVLPHSLYPSLLAASMDVGLFVCTKAIIGAWPHSTLNFKTLPNFKPSRFKGIKEHHHEVALAVAMALAEHKESKIQDVDLSSLDTSDREDFLRLLLKSRTDETEPVRKKRRRQKNATNGYKELRIIMNILFGNDAPEKLALHSQLPSANIKVMSRALEVHSINLNHLKEILNSVHREITTALSLSFNGLENLGIQIILPVVQKFRALTLLNLNNNKINVRDRHAHAAITTLGLALSSLTSLRYLRISDNRLTRRLPEILGPIKQPLMLLEVSNCMLALEDIVYLSGSHHAQYLQHLLLNGNFVVGRSWDATEQLLMKVSSTLVELDVAETCQFETQHAVSVARGLAKLAPTFRCLKSLEFDSNYLEADEQVEIVLAFVQCPSMRELRLSFPTVYVTQSWRDLRGRTLSPEVCPRVERTSIEWFTLTCWNKRSEVNPDYLSGSKPLTVYIYEEDIMRTPRSNFPIS